jgi:hypothetical protein
MSGETPQELVAAIDRHGPGGTLNQAHLPVGEMEKLHLISISKIAVPPVTTSSSANAATALHLSSSMVLRRVIAFQI